MVYVCYICINVFDCTPVNIYQGSNHYGPLVHLICSASIYYQSTCTPADVKPNGILRGTRNLSLLHGKVEFMETLTP